LAGTTAAGGATVEAAGAGWPDIIMARRASRIIFKLQA
jgi:hypothetical protein